jgi:hypothetical protein
VNRSSLNTVFKKETSLKGSVAMNPPPRAVPGTTRCCRTLLLRLHACGPTAADAQATQLLLSWFETIMALVATRITGLLQETQAPQSYASTPP